MVISQSSRSIMAALALTMAMATTPARAQPDAGVTRHISVTGQGEASGKPDIAEIDAGVQTLADTVVEASRENQAVLARILDALEQQGIADKDVQTANYSIWAEQDYGHAGGRADEPGKPRITGYRVSNIVHVKVRDISKTGDVLAAVTNAGANSVNGISFGVEDAAALESQAREAAMADARARAESLASLAGVELGEVLTVAMSASPGFPRPYAARMEMADAGVPVPGIAPGQQSVGVEIHATFAIRQAGERRP
jgi:uncharacterized protein